MILASFESLLLNIKEQNIFQSRIKYCSSSLGGKLRLISAAINIKAQARLVLKSLFADDSRLDKKNFSYLFLLIREKGTNGKVFRTFSCFSLLFQIKQKTAGKQQGVTIRSSIGTLIIIKIIHSETVNLDGALPRLQNKSPLFGPLFFFVY